MIPKDKNRVCWDNEITCLQLKSRNAHSGRQIQTSAIDRYTLGTCCDVLARQAYDPLGVDLATSSWIAKDGDIKSCNVIPIPFR